ncbi:protein JASON-like [Aristolochia californica]|uniref:protein JASON-like n=1 Tax=Aristolochia californica TaxID=171875 RepID=UPI0035DFC05B
MGCFLACFGSVDRRRQKRGRKSLPRDRSRRNYESLQPASPAKQSATEEAVVSLLESREKAENLSFNSRKKVTFDLNVNTYIEVHNSTEVLNSYQADEEKETENSDAKAEKQNEASTDSATQSNSSTNPVSFPSNHRYQNCLLSDEEVGDDDDDDDDDDEIESGDSDFEEVDDDGIEESYESCFSLPLGSEGKTSPHFDAKTEVNSPTPINSVNGPRDRSQYVHSVLNPIENLSQWKAVKAKPIPLKNQKENIALEEASSFELIFQSPKPKKPFETDPKDTLSNPSPNQEIPVDASLSNWLVSPMTTSGITVSPEKNVSPRSNSSKKYEDRPILGALTVEEIRWSASSSPRRSPSRSPDEIPILGTVGSYWNHQNKTMDLKGLPNTSSKYSEDKRVNWHSTPFEVRFERALSSGAAEMTC